MDNHAQRHDWQSLKEKACKAKSDVVELGSFFGRKNALNFLLGCLESVIHITPDITMDLLKPLQRGSTS